MYKDLQAGKRDSKQTGHLYGQLHLYGNQQFLALTFVPHTVIGQSTETPILFMNKRKIKG
jgi:hypothetical protein